jgi:hypothetical protein
MPSRKRPALSLAIAIGVLLGLGALALWLFFSMDGSALRATVVEQLTGETPEARIDAYVQAVLRGDAQSALTAWELPDWDLPAGRSALLAARREQVTRDLLGAGFQHDYMILHIEWWRTCCEPGPICSSREAGGARVSVQFLDREGRPLSYTLDLFTRDGAYWGGAMGYPPRQWALRDVYPTGEEPLFWRLVYEPAVRSLDTVTPDVP